MVFVFPRFWVKNISDLGSYFVFEVCRCFVSIWASEIQIYKKTIFFFGQFPLLPRVCCS